MLCPECDSYVKDDGYCMMGHWVGRRMLKVTVNIEFIKLARSLRLKQGEYFNNRQRSLLLECKQLERQFDSMLKSVLDVIAESEKEQSAIEAQRRLL